LDKCQFVHQHNIKTGEKKKRDQDNPQTTHYRIRREREGEKMAWHGKNAEKPTRKPESTDKENPFFLQEKKVD
jgi:hypothetical protein